MVDEPDDGLAHLNDLDVTWGFDRDAFPQRRTRQAPAAGDAGDGTANTMDSSQGGAVDTPSAPAGASKRVETMGSPQEGTEDASSVPTERAASDLSASAASGTDQGNGDVPPAILSGRAEHEVSSWGRQPATVRGRTWGQSQC